MKKVMLLFALCFLCMSCDPRHDYNPAQWYIKNSTEQTLKLEYYRLTQEIIIAPGESVLMEEEYYEDRPIIFDSRFKRMADLYGETLYLKILSEDNALLRTWTYLERNLSGKQYFNESSWRYFKTSATGNNSFVKAIWTFEILPEDISSE